MKLTVNAILLIVLGIAYVIIVAIRKVAYSPGLVDWNTISILASLIIVNTGLMRSGGLDFISYNLMKITKSQRELLFVSISLTALLSMFLTNDVALLVLIPITLSIGKFSKKSMDDIIIFQAMAANVGSMLMPFGNPQNIIMFRTFDLNFSQFLLSMLPMFLISLGILLSFSLIVKNAKVGAVASPGKPNFLYFAIFIAILIIVIISMLTDQSTYLFLAIIVITMVFLLLLEPTTILKVDYVLIVVFVLIFLVMNSLRQLVSFSPGNNPIEIFFLSLIFSQFISNVPATVLFGKVFSWVALSYGVNVGGNGTVIASLANIIALRNLSGKNFFRFNKFSFIFLLVTAALAVPVLLLVTR
ncbi:MAG: SLC13 family permease [Thermoplasmatales archaeon]